MGLNTEGARFSVESHLDTGVMEARYKSRPWYEAYMAALFESDRGQIGESIRRAELLIVSRERELFTCTPDPKEQHALNNALHALRALYGCLKL
jgi:hypothetical protein